MSPDPNPSLTSPGVALDDGLLDPDGLRTGGGEKQRRENDDPVRL